MTELSDAARAVVVLADHAAADAQQKLTLLGAFWTISGFQPSGFTAPQAVVVLVEVPPKFYGESFSLTVVLVDGATDQPVELPGTGALRIQQLVKVDRPSIPGIPLPDGVPGRLQSVLSFPAGLPLQPGKMYRWQVAIDTNSKPDWAAPFFVLGAPPAPLIG